MKTSLHHICIISLLLVAAVLFACNRIDPPLGKTNHPPFVPQAVHPADQSTDVLTPVTLQWSGGDPDGDPVTYHLMVWDAVDAVIIDATIVDETATQLSFIVPSLAEDQAYSWSVVATDTANHSASSPTWHFTTGHSMQYPLTLGSTWTYSGYERYDDPRPESLAYRVPTPTEFVSTVTVGPVSNSYGDIYPYAVQESMLHTAGQFLGAYHQTTYMRNFQNGLFAYGWTGNFIIGSTPKPSADAPRISFPGMPAVDLNEWMGGQSGCLSSEIRPDVWSSGPVAAADSSSGGQVLKYPLSVGQEWVYWAPRCIGRVVKRVAGIEQVQVPAGTFECYRIDWLFLREDGTKWSTFERTDYVAAEGLIKRVSYSPNAMFSTSSYTVFATYHGEIVLTGLQPAVTAP